MSSYSPWAQIEHLKDRRDKLKILSVILGSLSILLLLNSLFISPSPSSEFSSSLIMPLTLCCVGGTAFTALKYLQSDLMIQKIYQEDQISERQRDAIERAKEMLSKASRAKRPATRVEFPTHTYQRTSFQVEAPKLELNLKPFEYVDDSMDSFMRSKGFDKNIRNWISNVRMWFAKDFLSLILVSHKENLENLNRCLKNFTYNRRRQWIFEGTFDEPGNISPQDYHFDRASLHDVENLAREVGANYYKDLEIVRHDTLQHQSPVVNEAQMRVQFLELFRQRVIIEKYFEIPGYSARKYVVNRLYHLSNNLSSYSSNSGGTLFGNDWTPKKPTDAHIFAHLFFRMLNNANNPTVDPHFDCMNEIVINFGRDPPRFEKDNIAIFYQKNSESTIEPHFDLISGREYWPAFRGNDNLFCAVALFLYHVKHKSNGYFRSLNCTELLKLLN